MSNRAILSHSAVALLLTALAGCGVPTEIPAGNWAGQGIYVDYEGILSEKQPTPKERAKSNTYETTLKITKMRAFGRDALRFMIHSKSSNLFNGPSEDVKIDVVLVSLRTLPNGSTLYAAFSPKDVEPAKADSPLPSRTLPRATSTRTDGGVVLQLRYNPPHDDAPFTDTFHFLPTGVLKTGSFTTYSGDDKKKLVRVWWVEELRPE